MVLKTRHQKLQPAQRLRIYRRGKGKQDFGELRAIFEKNKIKARVNAPIALPSFFTLKIHAEFNVQVESGRHHIRE